MCPIGFNRFAEIGEEAAERGQLMLDKAAADGAALAALKAPEWLRHLKASIMPAPGLTQYERRVNVASEYGAPVEYGARPHWMPTSVIEGELAQWAADHGMPGAEWAIAAKIARDGTPAQPYLTPAMVELDATLPSALRVVVEGE